MSRLELLMIILILICLEGCRLLFGFDLKDRENYFLFKYYPSKHCEELYLCLSSEELNDWKLDSLGLIGARRKIFARNADKFKNGELNGISYDCLINLLGVPIDKYEHPVSDSSFTYQISQNHDSIIELGLWYNQHFDKVVDSYISISMKELPEGMVMNRKCSYTFYSEIDSLLFEKQNDLDGKFRDGTKKLSESERLYYFMLFGEPIIEKFHKENLSCFRCYFGEPDRYMLSYGKGVWNDYGETFRAFYDKKHYYFNLTVFFSRESEKIYWIKKSQAIP